MASSLAFARSRLCALREALNAAQQAHDEQLLVVRSLEESVVQQQAEAQVAARAKASLQQAAQGAATDAGGAASTSGRVQWADRFAWEAHMRKVAVDKFAIREFRPAQREALNATIAGADVLAVLPSGGGKSLIYFVPAAMDAADAAEGSKHASVKRRRGVTFVISPLVSLLLDQARHLQSAGIHSVAITADTPRAVAESCWKALNGYSATDAGGCDVPRVVFVTPERVAKSKRLISTLTSLYKKDALARLVVDEAHCVSQWGHDYRTDYLELSKLKTLFPEVPILAVTATAPPRVANDLKRQLRISGCVELRTSVDRPNLFYEIARKDSSPKVALAQLCALLKQQRFSGTGIVFCATQSEVHTVANAVHASGTSCIAYHAGMDAAVRESGQSRWSSGRARIAVATVAFGLGINKLDTRWVVHYSLPKSLESYYQESGRAGRDGLPARCLLLWHVKDVPRWSSIVYARGDLGSDMLVEGVSSLYEMARYAAHGACRRAAILRHFGETTKPPHARCCDVCARSARGDATAASPSDVAVHANVSRALTVIGESTEKPLTLAMVADKMGSGSSKENRITKEQREALALDLLLEGHMRETFTANAYAVNAYVELTASGRRMLRDSSRPDARCLSAVSSIPSVEALADIPPADDGKAAAAASSGPSPSPAKRARPFVPVEISPPPVEVVTIHDDDDDDDDDDFVR